MLAPLPRRCDRDDQVLATATVGSRSTAPGLAPSFVLWGSACGVLRRAMKMVSSTRAACLAASTSRRSAASLRLRLSRPCSRSIALVEAAPGGGIIPGEYRSSKRSGGVSDLRSANAEDGAAAAATEARFPALALGPLRRAQYSASVASRKLQQEGRRASSGSGGLRLPSTGDVDGRRVLLPRLARRALLKAPCGTTNPRSSYE